MGEKEGNIFEKQTSRDDDDDDDDDDDEARGNLIKVGSTLQIDSGG